MMSESQDDHSQWMKVNPEIHLLEGLGKEEDEVRHLRYGIIIGNQHLLFDKSILCEATINTTVYSIPNVSPWLSGMINLRGNLIPVFKIDKFLAEKKTSERENKVVFVIDEGIDAVGLLINELPVAVEIDEESTESIPHPDNVPEIFSDAISNTYEIDKIIWLEIDISIVIENLKSLETNDLA